MARRSEALAFKRKFAAAALQGRMERLSLRDELVQFEGKDRFASRIVRELCQEEFPYARRINSIIAAF
jgi:hypothetical protein